jgi:hypothetical protein
MRRTKPSGTGLKKRWEVFEKQLLPYQISTPGRSSYLMKSLIKQYGINTGVILSLYLEMHSILKDRLKTQYDGWFPCSINYLIIETGLAASTVKKIRKKIAEDFGLVSSKSTGMPLTKYFKLNFEELANICDAYALAQTSCSDCNCPTVCLHHESIPMFPDGSKVTQHDGSKTTQHGRSIHVHHPYYKDKLHNKEIDNKDIYLPNTPKRKSVKERNKMFIPLAEQLASIIKKHKNIQISKNQIYSWADDIRKLNSINKIKKDRIESLLVWYNKNYGNPFIPVAESGKSFREKFTRIEDAQKREKSPNPSGRSSQIPKIEKHKRSNNYYAEAAKRKTTM